MLTQKLARAIQERARLFCMKHPSDFEKVARAVFSCLNVGSFEPTTLFQPFVRTRFLVVERTLAKFLVLLRALFAFEYRREIDEARYAAVAQNLILFRSDTMGIIVQIQTVSLKKEEKVLPDVRKIHFLVDVVSEFTSPFEKISYSRSESSESMLGYYRAQMTATIC